MPLRRSVQYLHAAWVSEGVHTEWREQTEDERKETASLYKRLKYLTRHG